MTSKRDVERRLDDLEATDGDREPDDVNPYSLTDEELAEAWRAALDPERPTPVDGEEAYIELLERSEGNE